MKKTFLLFGLLVATLNVDAKVTYQKDNGGLFGYKTVQQTNMNDGSVTVVCTNPGWTRCRAQTLRTVDGNTLTGDEIDKIDAAVSDLISSTEKGTGKLVFDNRYVVTYKYNEHSDRLTVEIYTFEEAKLEGIVF